MSTHSSRALFHGAAAAILAESLIACTQPTPPAVEPPTLGVMRQQAIAGMPADSEFYPYRCVGAAAGDVLSDPVTGDSHRDLVGDATYPAFYRAADATRVFFRMRLNGDPRKPGGGGTLSPSSYDVLVNTDANLNTYEYMLTADGNMFGTAVQWVRNSVQDGTSTDRAMDNPAGDLLFDLLPSTDYYDVRVTGDGSAYNGDPDYFITIAIPKTALTAVGINPASSYTVWFGSNAANYTLNSDFGCAVGIPANLSDADTDAAPLEPASTPVAVADTVTTNEDTAVTTSVLANDTGLRDTPLTVTITTPPTRGTAVVNAGYTVTYTPNANYNGSDSYTYRVQDADGQFSSAVVSLTVNPVNDGAPVAVNDTVTTAEDTAVTTNVLANDTNLGDAPITVSIAAAPTNGTVMVNAGNTVTYTPAANYSGSDSYTYRVTDVDGQSSTAVVFLFVSAVNDTAPVAVDDTATVDEDSAVTTTVLANDSGLVDAPVAVTVNSAPANGFVVVNGDRSITYIPNANYYGPDSYTYRVTDVDGQSSVATVSL
ncbi:MAG TPA: cadherin-like domain-containing protein, partial [Myxococcaceae bacterium]|nr:cadherin-like domain-containing protein [Myxococcaceae bacterium]